MRKLRSSGMPESEADATVEIAEDVTRGPLTQEQLEATLYRALFIQAVVIIATMTAIIAAFTIL